MSKNNINELNALTDELTGVLEGALEEALPLVEQEDTDLRGLERVTRAMIMRVGRRFLELLVEGSRPDEKEETVPCRCGGTSEFARCREGTVITTFEQIEFARAYFLCPECHQGMYPPDERLGLCAGGLSAALQETLALIGIHAPFEVSRESLERLTQVSISDNGVRESTERIGQERLEAEQALVGVAWDPDCFKLPESPEEPPDRLYGSIDGTSVRREEGWQEAKLGCWYTTDEAAEREPLEEWTPRAEDISYYGDIKEAEKLGRLVYLKGRQQGAHKAEEIVLVAVGAIWI